MQYIENAAMALLMYVHIFSLINRHARLSDRKNLTVLHELRNQFIASSDRLKIWTCIMYVFNTLYLILVDVSNAQPNSGVHIWFR